MNLQLIEIAIGLVFVYLLLSIFAMAVMEMISTFLRMRGEMLKTTIGKMFFDKSRNPGKIDEFYKQPLILFLGDDVSTWAWLDSLLSDKYKKLPSYIKSEDFYMTFLAFVNDQKFSDSLPEIGEKIEQSSFSDETRSHLRFLVQKSNGDITHFKQEIIHWFDECMERANTWYSRKVQYILLVLGLAVSVAVNGDTLRMIKMLNKDEQLRKELVQSASGYVQKNSPAGTYSTITLHTKIGEEYKRLLSESHNLLGWENTEEECKEPLEKGVGFLLTAFAISLGSNFWFDMLKKLFNVRTLGKPTQK